MKKVFQILLLVVFTTASCQKNNVLQIEVLEDRMNDIKEVCGTDEKASLEYLNGSISYLNGSWIDEVLIDYNLKGRIITATFNQPITEVTIQSIKDVKIPDTVTDLYIHMTGKSIDIPRKVKNLKLSSCKSLKHVRIPDSVTELYLSGCESLKHVKIPDSVTKLNLSRCKSLKHVRIPDSVTDLDLSGCESLQHVKIPDSVTEFLDLRGCESLKHVELPESITELGYMAFQDCKSLKSIRFPESISTIILGEMIVGCESLKKIFVSEYTEVYGQSAFPNLEIIWY